MRLQLTILDEAFQRALRLRRSGSTAPATNEELLTQVLERGVALLERDGRLPPLPGPPSPALDRLNALRQEVLEARAAGLFLLQRTLLMVEEYERLERSTDELAEENRRLRDAAWTARAVEEQLKARIAGQPPRGSSEQGTS